MRAADELDIPSVRLTTRATTDGPREPTIELFESWSGASGGETPHGFEVVADEADPTGWELAVVLTDHGAIDHLGVATQVGGVFDARGVYRRLGLEVADVVRP